MTYSHHPLTSPVGAVVLVGVVGAAVVVGVVGAAVVVGVVGAAVVVTQQTSDITKAFASQGYLPTKSQAKRKI